MSYLTRAQVREFDRRCIEQYHIPGIVLMENAALAVADVACGMLVSQQPGAVVVCGGGNNGGDGFAVARHLHNRGFLVSLELAVDPAKLTGDALTNFNIATAMKLPLHAHVPVAPALVIDALFGTGLSQPPRAEQARVIEWMNRCDAPILSIDVPSGLDCDTGLPLGASCVRATKTVTFLGEKIGFMNPASKQYTGEVIVVGDIGCPWELLDEFGVWR